LWGTLTVPIKEDYGKTLRLLLVALTVLLCFSLAQAWIAYERNGRMSEKSDALNDEMNNFEIRMRYLEKFRALHEYEHERKEKNDETPGR
jgi:hypothetical protein